jgi:hypothetical protein
LRLNDSPVNVFAEKSGTKSFSIKVGLK